MNWLDLVFLGFVVFSVLVSVVRGFVRELLSVVVWVAAAWLALRFSSVLGDWLGAWIPSPTLALVAAFAVIFVGTLLVGAVAAFMARALVNQTGLTGTDRVLGAVFGGLRGALVVGVLVLVAGLTTVPRESWWQASLVAGTVQPWVCRLGVYHWLDDVRVYRPLASGGEVPGRPASSYWREFCVGIQAGTIGPWAGRPSHPPEG